MLKENTNEFNQKFDYAFGQDSTQIAVFDRVHTLLGGVLKGINLTVFAYG